jgi:MYXO-CTERM domain-containing protein
MQFRLVAWATGLALLIGTTAAPAVTLYDSSGFEPGPPGNNYVLGDLNGQPSGGIKVWVKDKPDATAVGATVQTVIKQAGVQAVELQRDLTDVDTRWGVEFDIAPAQRYLVAEWDQYLSPGATGSPYFGVEASDFIAGRLIAYAVLDPATSEVVASGGGFGNPANAGQTTATGSFAGFSVWNRFQLEMDYVEWDYRLLMNGIPIWADTFADAWNANTPGPITGFTDAPMVSFTQSGGAGATGTSYYDNYMLTLSNQPVPEPGMLGLAGLVAVFALRRQNRWH